MKSTIYFLLAILIIFTVRADIDEGEDNSDKFTHAEIVYPPGTYEKLSKVSLYFSHLIYHNWLIVK